MKAVFWGSGGCRGWRRALACAGAAAALVALAGLARALAMGATTAPPAASPAASPSATAPGRATARVVTAARPGDHLIALTFDDGPDPRFTPEILAILRRYRAEATFFVVGQEAQRHPDLVRAIAAAGSEVASHGWSHTSFQRLSEGAMEEELARTNRLIRSLTGRPARLFRPPYGRYNATVLSVAARLGMTVVLWTPGHDPFDWAGALPGLIVQRCCNRIQGGEIILLHDGGGDRRNTVRALGAILERLRAEHYQVVTVSEMLERAARLGSTGRSAGSAAAPRPAAAPASR
ncbi:MAG: polysaccharide deacetylase family protein [Firmicutes bacterium]|nr:polysaccharide deacetylase family protein [Bacillota bacterium]